jgi:hypothetical protein
MMKKIPIILVALASMPVVLKSVGYFWTPLISADRELFYVLPFVLGMILSEYNVLSKVVDYGKEHKWSFLAGSSIVVIECLLVRTQMEMITDVVYAFAIILFGIGISLFDFFLLRFFLFLGKYSMDIFLIHSFVYYYFTVGNEFLSHFSNKIIKFVVFMIINILVALVINGLKKIWKTVYSYFCSNAKT